MGRYRIYGTSKGQRTTTDNSEPTKSSLRVQMVVTGKSTATVVLVAATSLTAAAAAALFLGRSGRKPSKLSLWLARIVGCNSFVLANVRVPVAVLGKETKTELMVDREGLVECTVHVKSGIIAEVTAGGSGSNGILTLPVVDCLGAVLVPCFCDAHTHLVKTQIVPRNRNSTGTINEALEVEACDQPRWKVADDVYRRMDFAVRCALAHGTRAVRTHLDGCAVDDAEISNSVYAAYDKLQESYNSSRDGRSSIVIQGVANLYLPLWSIPDIAEKHVATAKRHANVVLGAYVGNTADTPDEETFAQLHALFGYARQHGMDVDMHIDETNDPRCCSLLVLCRALDQARQAGYSGKVVLGHCCSLSLQNDDTRSTVCQQLAKLGAYVVSNPFTNLGLQDRKGSGPPYCGPYIDADEARTPQWRGLTLLQELRAAGVVVAAASDNVRDHWYPYGDYDMLSVWDQAQGMGHLDTAPSEGSWADICSVGPAEAMGVAVQRVAPGEPADLVLFPSSRRASELFARPQMDRIILRRGACQTAALPSFAELDDLVEVKTDQNVGLNKIPG